MMLNDDSSPEYCRSSATTTKAPAIHSRLLASRLTSGSLRDVPKATPSAPERTARSQTIREPVRLENASISKTATIARGRCSRPRQCRNAVGEGAQPQQIREVVGLRQVAGKPVAASRHQERERDVRLDELQGGENERAERGDEDRPGELLGRPGGIGRRQGAADLDRADEDEA